MLFRMQNTKGRLPYFLNSRLHTKSDAIFHYLAFSLASQNGNESNTLNLTFPSLLN